MPTQFPQNLSGAQVDLYTNVESVDAPGTKFIFRGLVANDSRDSVGAGGVDGNPAEGLDVVDRTYESSSGIVIKAFVPTAAIDSIVVTTP